MGYPSVEVRIDKANNSITLEYNLQTLPKKSNKVYPLACNDDIVKWILTSDINPDLNTSWTKFREGLDYCCIMTKTLNKGGWYTYENF